ncbi:hypothetical protein PM082_000259 [Marasmius tenuissimus]|nr:hypothetical protein PM082_000259 [Marasmius tenuissimus]
MPSCVSNLPGNAGQVHQRNVQDADDNPVEPNTLMSRNPSGSTIIRPRPLVPTTRRQHHSVP